MGNPFCYYLAECTVEGVLTVHVVFYTEHVVINKGKDNGKVDVRSK